MRPLLLLSLAGCFAQVDASSDLPDGSSPGAGTALTPSTTEPADDSAEAACVDGINAYRATLGLDPYDRWVDTEDCVAGQAEDDFGTGVAHSAFGQCGEMAQNECPGWPGPPGDHIQDCLDMMWAEGPGENFDLHGHYINMSSEDYTQVACGFFELPDGSWWGAQDFR